MVEAYSPLDGLQALDYQLAAVRANDTGYLRPTVMGVVYAPSEEKLVLCVPDDRADESREAWKFPQEGIKRSETSVTATFLRGMEEELGISPGEFKTIYGLPGKWDGQLLGTPYVNSKGTERCKIFFPVVGVLRDVVELVPQPEELAQASWMSILEVWSIFANQDPTRQSVQNRIAVFGRFCIAAETAKWSYRRDSLVL